MIEGYSNRMLQAPRYVREGNRLIPESALVRVKVAPAPAEVEASQGADAPAAPEGK